MEKVLNGKPVTTALVANISELISTLPMPPVMALIRMGNDPASGFYVQNIIKQGTKLGCAIKLMELEQTVCTEQVLSLIAQCNENPAIHGIMVQKPLPRHIDSIAIDNAISPDKDIDGINPLSLGRLFLEQESFAPCTAEAVIETIRYYGIETCGKHIVILGRSAVVGKPLAGLLLNKSNVGNATVTVCHSKTADIASITAQADILVAAIGSPHFVTAEMIGTNCVCLDVGINAIADAEKGQIYVGDIDYKGCYDKALAITPVPGGIGSVTTAILIRNLVKAAEQQNSR
jgi:methylenetetrahydrofolate dehydrogenase (NADP+)/methenyltetrahydrofolate cyclohydrolase